MEPADAARAVLSDDPGSALHWTVIWDRALRSGYIDPLSQPEARNQLIRALSAGAAAGEWEKASTGTYRLVKGSPKT